MISLVIQDLSTQETHPSHCCQTFDFVSEIDSKFSEKGKTDTKYILKVCAWLMLISFLFYLWNCAPADVAVETAETVKESDIESLSPHAQHISGLKLI